MSLSLPSPPSSSSTNPDSDVSDVPDSDSNSNPKKYRFKYEIVNGIFLQSDSQTVAATFDPASQNLGLQPQNNVNPGMTDWQRLAKLIEDLNTFSPPNIQYKLLYLSRHGQGEHNVAEAQYGTTRWNDKWAMEAGDGTINWVDAKLTDLGESQAKTARELWERLIPEGIPLPQSYYVSPLQRCLATARHTFGTLALPEDRKFQPVVKEMAREVLGRHTCDQRSSLSYIKENYPEFAIEEGFSEEDRLWKANHREEEDEVDERIEGLLDEVFKDDEGLVISFTTHSGAITSFLRVLGHRPFRLRTGHMIPCLVTAERVEVQD